MSTTFRILLLAGLVICAGATALVRIPGPGHHRGRRGRGDHRHPVLPDPAAYQPH